MTGHHLAQLNIARLVAPLDSPQLADFVGQLPAVNALAEASPGYVWRLVGEDNDDATEFRPFGVDDVIINLTVWESVEALRDFTYRTGHLEPMRRRREWFQPYGGAYLVLWWIPAGHLPTIGEAVRRLALLESNGPTPEAFTFREAYPPPVTRPAVEVGASD